MLPPITYRLLSIAISLLPRFLRAKLWYFMTRLGQRRWPVQSKSQRIPGGMYVKIGPFAFTRLSEGEIMRHVGSHTSVPVPVVVDNFIYGDWTYLVMSRLPGRPLIVAYEAITPEVERLLSVQLSRILASLRTVASPSPRVEGWGGTPVYCERLRLDAKPTGPWDSVDEFHKALMWRARRLLLPAGLDAKEVDDVIRRAHSRPHRICLTHNDLGPHNILIDNNWNITGIIDWEASAWMPEYWELTKSTFLPWFRKGCWHRIMSAALPTYALEQKAEEYIINYREGYT